MKIMIVFMDCWSSTRICRKVTQIEMFGCMMGTYGLPSTHQTEEGADKREAEIMTELHFIQYARLLRKAKPELRALSIFESTLENLKNGEDDDLA